MFILLYLLTGVLLFINFIALCISFTSTFIIAFFILLAINLILCVITRMGTVEPFEEREGK